MSLTESAEHAHATADAPTADLDVRTSLSNGQVVVVAVAGEIDLATAPRLWDHLAGAIIAATSRLRLVVDLSATTFVDSTALAVFVRAHNQLRRQGGELVLCAPNTAARTVLSITGLDQLLTIEDGPPAPASS